MEKWTFKYNRLWTIVVVRNGIIYKARATNEVVSLDTLPYTTFNEAKDEAINLAKNYKKILCS